jgi:hypothetical protein
LGKELCDIGWFRSDGQEMTANDWGSVSPRSVAGFLTEEISIPIFTVIVSSTTRSSSSSNTHHESLPFVCLSGWDAL